MKIALRAEIYLEDQLVERRGVINIKPNELGKISNIREEICNELKQEFESTTVKDIKIFWAPYTGGKVVFKEIKPKEPLKEVSTDD